MRIQPLHDWAVIIPSEAVSRTAGGLYIPDTAREKPAEGTVESIGPGAYEEAKRDKKKDKKERKFVPTSVRPGERVLYDRYAGRKFTLENGAERVLVREANILGILPARPDRPNETAPPLQIPAATASQGANALVKRGTAPIAVRPEAPKPAVMELAGKSPARKKAPAKPKKKAAARTGRSAAAATGKAAPAAKKTAKKKAAKKTKKKR